MFASVKFHSPFIIHRVHDAPCLPPPPPHTYITIVFNFSWDDCNTQEKLETVVNLLQGVKLKNINLFVLLDINLCDSGPCQNNASCENFRTFYTCNCAAGFEGVNCQTGKTLCPYDFTEQAGKAADIS